MTRQRAIFLIPFVIVFLGFASRPAPHAQTNALPAKQSAAPARFEFGGNAAEVPAEFVGNLIFLPARVNEAQPSLFELDSNSATSSIDPDRAAELGLTAGESSANASSAVPASLQNLSLHLPGVEIPALSLSVRARIDFAADVGRRYQGAIGNDFLERVIVEIDYARQTVRLYDPSVYKYTGRGVSVPLTFIGDVPVVHAKFSAPKGRVREADFAVCTALDDAIVLSGNYEDSHHVVTSHLKTASAYRPEWNGSENNALGRLKEFQIGKHPVAESIAVFAQRLPVATGNSNLAGLIGGGLLKRYTVTFDYPHRQMFLDPNTHFGDFAEEDMSGLSVLARGPGLRTFVIANVAPATPASEAGIQKGDVIAGIDDEAAADLTLVSIRSLFRQIGHRYKLLLERNGVTLQVTIQMRRLV